MESRGPYNPCGPPALIKPRLPGDLTELLLAWRDGDEDALKRLTPLVLTSSIGWPGSTWPASAMAIPCRPRRS